MARLFELTRHYTLQSARYLTGIDASHICARMHGHTFQIEVTVAGTLDPKTEWVVDWSEMDRLWERDIASKLEHVVLNEVEGLENPTSENLCAWIFERYKVPGTKTIATSVNETGFSKITLRA